MPTFHDLAVAAYCLRQLYYERRDDFDVPDRVDRVRALAHEYPALLDASPESYTDRPITVPPAHFKQSLRAARDRLDAWHALVDPDETDVVVTGRDARGVVHKVIAGPRPAVVATGDPPPNGVWGGDSVRAVAAAKALAWTHETPVETAFVEYPAHGVIRRVDLTTQRVAAYRRVLRSVRSMDGPPPRLRGNTRCSSCTFRARCGVRSRSLLSLR